MYQCTVPFALDSLYIVCTQSVHSLYIVCTQSALSLYIVCTQSVHSLYIVCTQSVHSLYIVCTQSALSLYIVCTQSVHSLSNLFKFCLQFTVNDLIKKLNNIFPITPFKLKLQKQARFCLGLQKKYRCVDEDEVKPKSKEYEIEGRYNCRGPPYPVIIHDLQTVLHLYMKYSEQVIVYSVIVHETNISYSNEVPSAKHV